MSAMLAGAGSVALWLVAVLLVVLGFAGTILPMLPGAPLVFAGLFVAAWTDGFAHVGWPTLVVLGVLTVVTLLVDFAATALGARRAGASTLAVVGAALGTVIGVFFALPGIILGPFAGAVVGEYTARARIGDATRVGFSTWLGLLFGTLFKIALLCAMVGIFVWGWIV